MGTDSKIAWTHHTFNPWIGCHKIDPACVNCYAADLAARYGWAEWGANGTRRVKAESGWREPHKWNRDAEAAGQRRRVFCASLADVFEDWNGQLQNGDGRFLWVNESDEWVFQALPGRSDAIFFEQGFKPLRIDDVRRRLFKLIDATPWLDWLLLTKRPENVASMWPTELDNKGFTPVKRCRENVWLGTTAGTQASAEKRIPELLKLRGLSPVLFVSAEPLLEPVEFRNIPLPGTNFVGGADVLRGGYWSQWPVDDDWFVGSSNMPTLDWVIGGLESGDDRRDPGVEPLVELARQCVAARVPFFCKQDCARTPGQRGRIPADVWKLKQFPTPQKVTA